ncbi:MAG: DUF6765 family protein [Thermodesulfobacteriota bacterium]|nr:DUF6765 family protein [Thermodesulfobacteriota bacterium]
MDIEFHYYITGIIAKRAGFSEDEAKIISYTSQYVDDNDVILSVEDRRTEEVYSNYISQTKNILKPRKALMRIYPIFHFVPGNPMTESAWRNDGKMHILNTTPDNDTANELLSNAFTASPEMRSYRIGIATHAYVDTWAHQNFAGFNDSFNGSILNPIPNVGHAESLYHPDWVSHRWEDDRLMENEVDNNLRFISAAKRLFENYVDYLGSEASWDNLEVELLSALGRSRHGDQTHRQAERLEQYSEMAQWLPRYDEDLWFEEAIECKICGLKDSQDGILSRFTIFKDEYRWKEDVNKEETHWFKFQEAVKEHQAVALGPVNEKCKTMGIDIRLL